MARLLDVSPDSAPHLPASAARASGRIKRLAHTIAAPCHRAHHGNPAWHPCAIAAKKSSSNSAAELPQFLQLQIAPVRTPFRRQYRTALPIFSCAVRNGTPLCTRYVAAAIAFRKPVSHAVRIRFESKSSARVKPASSGEHPRASRSRPQTPAPASPAYLCCRPAAGLSVSSVDRFRGAMNAPHLAAHQLREIRVLLLRHCARAQWKTPPATPRTRTPPSQTASSPPRSGSGASPAPSEPAENSNDESRGRWSRPCCSPLAPSNPSSRAVIACGPAPASPPPPRPTPAGTHSAAPRQSPSRDASRSSISTYASSQCATSTGSARCRCV